MRIAKYVYSDGDLSRAIMLIIVYRDYQKSRRFHFIVTVTVALGNRLSMREFHLHFPTKRIRMMDRKEVKIL